MTQAVPRRNRLVLFWYGVRRRALFLGFTDKAPPRRRGSSWWPRLGKPTVRPTKVQAAPYSPMGGMRIETPVGFESPLASEPAATSCALAILRPKVFPPKRKEAIWYNANLLAF